MTLTSVLRRYRTWLGFGSARFVSVPVPIMRLIGRLGDLFGDGPVSTNSLVQMVAGNDGDSAAFERAIGFRPAGLAEAQARCPAQVQDRWHARLFFLAPALTGGLLAMWVASALLGFLFGQQRTIELVQALGLSVDWAAPLRVAGTMVDLAIAALLLIDRRGRWSTMAQVVVVLGYTIILSVGLPRLWVDPLGPLLKNLPALLAILVHGAIRNNR